MVAGNKKELTQFDFNILKALRASKKPKIAVISKIDRIKKELLLEKIQTLSKECDFEAIIPVSSVTKEGIEELKTEIIKKLKEGPKYYLEDEYTDQTIKEMAAEIIRGKLLKLLYEEIPHGLFVEIEEFKLRKTKTGEDIYHILAIINTKKSSHKGIIVGKGGETLKKIGQYAREDLEKFLDAKVNLRTWVKVKKNWVDNELEIRRFKKK